VTVVGVAADARYRDLTTLLSDPGEDPEIYLPFAQAATGSFDVVVRSRNGALTSARLLQQAVSELDPSVPIYDVAPLSRVLDSQTASARFASFVLGLFGVAALALSAIGLYGVMAFMVGARQREIAVRLAIGASPDSVLRMVLRQGLVLTGVGLAIGLAAAVVGGRFLEGLLYQVRPSDPLTLLAVSGLLLATTVLANLLPARRATRVDPQLALRSE
jgi:putative ABC transport system permease protein